MWGCSNINNNNDNMKTVFAIPISISTLKAQLLQAESQGHELFEQKIAIFHMLSLYIYIVYSKKKMQQEISPNF